MATMMGIQYMNLQNERRKLAETQRHNQVTESVDKGKLQVERDKQIETARHNLVDESNRTQEISNQFLLGSESNRIAEKKVDTEAATKRESIAQQREAAWVTAIARSPLTATATSKLPKLGNEIMFRAKSVARDIRVKKGARAIAKALGKARGVVPLIPTSALVATTKVGPQIQIK